MKNILIKSGFIAFAMLFILTGCKKENIPIPAITRTLVSGVVIDKSSKTSLINSSVLLISSVAGCDTCQTTTVANVQSDGEGNYSFNFIAQDGKVYFVAASKDKYFDSGKILIKPGTDNKNVELALYPEAFIKIHVKNAKPFDFNDVFDLISGLRNDITDKYCLGPDIDTIITGMVKGNTENTITWIVKKNSISKTYKKAVYCTASDTTNYEIVY